MLKTFYMRKEDAFSRNLSECKSAVFGLRYCDITAMCGIPQSTMATYEGNRAPYISPFLSAAKKLSDMYCTTVQRLCSYDIAFDSEETLEMSGNFIRRLGGADTATYRDEIFSELSRHLHFTTKEIREMILGAHREIIGNFCKEGKYAAAEDDAEICSVFTDNLNYLLTMTGLSYRNVGSVCGIGLGTMSRLKQGAEPSLSVVIRLADFFGVPIEELLSPDPGFDAMKIIAETKGKGALADREDPVPEEMWQKAMKESHDDVYADEARRLVTEYLSKIQAQPNF